MSRRPTDARSVAEAMFKPKIAGTTIPAPKPVTIPSAAESVTLRINCDVLEHFQKAGAGWEARINQALRKAAGK